MLGLSTPPVAAQKLVKAWVNFTTMTTTVINDAFNVSSLVDNGTGDTTVNFEDPMPNTNYCITGAGRLDNASGSQCIFVGNKRGTTFGTGSIRINCGANNSSAANDCAVVCLAVYSN